MMFVDIEGSLAFRVLVWVVVLAFSTGCLVVFAVQWRRRRVYVTGVRGTGLVIRVEPTPWTNRYSVVEPATEMVTVATQHLPRGSVPQKVPAGQYVVGQEVAVVQPRGRSQDVRLDRPDLEPSAWGTWGFGLMVLAAPLIAMRALAG